MPSWPPEEDLSSLFHLRTPSKSSPPQYLCPAETMRDSFQNNYLIDDLTMHYVSQNWIFALFYLHSIYIESLALPDLLFINFNNHIVLAIVIIITVIMTITIITKQHLRNVCQLRAFPSTLCEPGRNSPLPKCQRTSSDAWT